MKWMYVWIPTKWITYGQNGYNLFPTTTVPHPSFFCSGVLMGKMKFTNQTSSTQGSSSVTLPHIILSKTNQFTISCFTHRVNTNHLNNILFSGLRLYYQTIWEILEFIRDFLSQIDTQIIFYKQIGKRTDRFLEKNIYTFTHDVWIIMICFSQHSAIVLWIEGWFQILILIEIRYFNSVELCLSLIAIKCMFRLNDLVNYFSKSTH